MIKNLKINIYINKIYNKYIQFYSTDKANIINKPVRVYKDLSNKELKKFLFSENKNLSGIYRWTNIINNKSYIGSSTNLARRFKGYFSPYFLNKQLYKGKSIIYDAINKYGYINFKLEILEYCKPDDCIKLEQYYLDTLNPEYNICKIAGSMLGFKHSEVTIIKMKKTKSKDHINKLRIYRKKLHSEENSIYKSKDYKNKLAIRSARAKPVEVLDIKTSIRIKFSSANRAALYIGCHRDTISSKLRLNITNPIKSRYIVKYIK